MARRRIADRPIDVAQIAAVTRSGMSAEDGARRLQASGVAISARTLSRRRKDVADAAQRRRVRTAAVRTAGQVLGALLESDRETVLEEMRAMAQEAVDERNQEIEAVLVRLGAAQDAMPACPTCGLRGANSRLVGR